VDKPEVKESSDQKVAAAVTSKKVIDNRPHVQFRSDTSTAVPPNHEINFKIKQIIQKHQKPKLSSRKTQLKA
jgi:hypothetical protein